VTAYLMARDGHSVTILADRFPCPSDPVRVDCVPAQFVALLVDLGIHPRTVGMDRLHDQRLLAWQSETPIQLQSPPFACIERPALDLALLAVVERGKRVSLVVGSTPRLVAGGSERLGSWGLVLDATGRRAVTASRRESAPKPFIGRAFHAPVRGGMPTTTFGLAALPDGYAYVASTGSTVCLGIVGRGAAVSGSAADVCRYVRSFAGWLLDQLPPADAMRVGIAQAASIQSAHSDWAVCIGDAAFARDALSSQGLATGVSDAQRVARLIAAERLTALPEERCVDRRSHVAILQGVISECRFAETPCWQGYLSFLQDLGCSRGQATPTILHSKLQ